MIKNFKYIKFNDFKKMTDEEKQGIIDEEDYFKYFQDIYNKIINSNLIISFD